MNIVSLLVKSYNKLLHHGEFKFVFVQRQPDLFTHITKKKMPFEGFFFRILGFFKFLIKNFSWRSPVFKDSEVLIFADSNNQFNSLESTIKELGFSNISLSVLLGKKVKSNLKEYIRLCFSFPIVVIATLLFIRRVLPLYRKVKATNKSVLLNKYFDVFCHSYAYLPYFLDAINQSKPRLIIVSNDHNPSNLCLLTIAKDLNIQTLYMQHASVSDLFPPLDFDYALLDVKIALNNYLKAAQKLVNSGTASENDFKSTKIFLTGQKKNVSRESINSGLGGYIGLAVNGLDHFDDVWNIVDQMLKNKYKVLLRTHPNQPKEFMEQLLPRLKSTERISWSDPYIDSLSDYFSNISCLIAGNSSIHLEAALVGLPTFYLEMNNDVSIADYYGYVSSGISSQLTTPLELDKMEEAIFSDSPPERINGIRMFSETFGTEWDGKEGLLAKMIVEKILSGDSFVDLLPLIETSSFYGEVYRLKE